MSNLQLFHKKCLHCFQELKNNTKNYVMIKQLTKTDNLLPICCSMYIASSDGALGIIPGSLKEVLSKELIVKANNNAPTTGNNGDTWYDKNGQLKNKRQKISVAMQIVALDQNDQIFNLSVFQYIN